MAGWSNVWGGALTATVIASCGLLAQAPNPGSLPAQLPPQAPTQHAPLPPGFGTHLVDGHGQSGSPIDMPYSSAIMDLTPQHLPPAATHLECEPKHKDDSGFYGWAEYLLIRPRVRALGYAIVDPVDDLSPQGTIERLNLETRSAFRVGGGYRFKSGWEFGGSYTFLRSGDEAGVGAPPGGVISPQLTRPGLVDRVDIAAASAGLDYDVWDLEIGRRFQLDETFGIRFATGLQFAAIYQDLTADYDGRDALMTRSSFRDDFFGVGPFIGGEGEWRLPHGFSLFGSGRVALNYGDFTTRYLETDDGGLTVNANITEDFSEIIPMARLGLGLSWRYGRFHARAGYEVTNWFNLVQRAYNYDDFGDGKFALHRSDLSLEGIFIRLGWAY